MPRRKGQAVKSYKIYLTKSFDAARVICEGLKREEPWTLDGGKMYLVYLGKADGGKLRIPEIYQGRGYYYACIEYSNGPDESRPKYEIVIC